MQVIEPRPRPAVALVDVDGFYSDHLTASRDRRRCRFFTLENVRQLVVRGTPGVPDFTRAQRCQAASRCA